MVLIWVALGKGVSKACKEVSREVKVGNTQQWADFWPLLSGVQYNEKSYSRKSLLRKLLLEGTVLLGWMDKESTVPTLTCNLRLY